MKYPRLYGVVIDIDGTPLLFESTQGERDGKMLGMLGTTRMEMFYPRKKYAGHNVAVVTNAYVVKSDGNRNSVASLMCGGEVFGKVIVLRLNGDGFKCLMTLKKARKIKEAIQYEYGFS